MKILLIEPAKAPVTLGGEDAFLFEPLALEYVAAGTVADHDVRILDQRIDHDVDAVLEEFRPDIVGITAYTVHAGVVRRLFEDVKRRNPRTLTVVGGHHATVAPQDFLSPSIDLLVIGEGVAAFREIARRLERGEGYGGIPGTALREAGGLLFGPPAEALDLDALPPPARSLTPKYRRGYYCEYMKPLASIRTSKGCPHRCNFCALWKLAGGRYFRRAPECIVQELSSIEEPFVFFADDESLIDAPRMMDLARRIRQAGISKRYFLYGRSDTIARHPELIEAWKGIGLERVFVGFESSRDEDLQAIRKGSTTGDNAQAAKILRSFRVDIYASFIIRPDFGKSDFAALRDYCRALDLPFASFAVLTPLPGTDLYASIRERMISHEFAFFDFIHTLLPTRLPLEEFYEEYYRLYRTAVPFRNAMAFLWKYPLREIPGLLAKSRRIFNQIRSAHKDYAHA